MESKINIKELAKNLRSLNAAEQNPQVMQVDEDVKEPVPIVEYIEEEVEKSTKSLKEKAMEQPIVSVKKAKKEPIEPVLPKNDPLSASLQAEFDLYDFSKQVWIDAEIYEVLVQIKRKKKIKNISVLVTSIIEEYINQNKTAIFKLFDSKLMKQG